MSFQAYQKSLSPNETTARRGAKPTPNANPRKGQTKPPHTRNSQSQRRHKRPNRNQPQTLGPCRKHSIVLTGGIPPARGFVQTCIGREYICDNAEKIPTDFNKMILATWHIPTLAIFRQIDFLPYPPRAEIE